MPEARIVPRVRKPSHEETSRLARLLWEARGKVDGSAEQDWYAAERALRGDYTSVTVWAIVHLRHIA